MTKSRNINQKWNTEESIVKVALTTHSRSDFKTRYPGAYRAAYYTLGFYDELSNMMVAKGIWKNNRRQSPSKYALMTDEQIISTALKLKSLTQLNKSFLLSVEAKKRNIYNEIVSQLKRQIHQNNYWNELRIYKKARGSKSRSEFCDTSAGKAAIRLGIYDKLVEDMSAEGIWDLSHYRKWTKESCFAKIREFETKSELIEDCWSAYNYARKHNFLEEACEHMKRLGSAVLRKVYVFEFDDHSAYVGLSYNPENRLQRHLNEEDSAVFLHIKSTNCNYDFKILTDFLNKEEAAIQEEKYRIHYMDDGWRILNRMKCGGLGGTGYPQYTKEEIGEEIIRLGIKTRSQFNKQAKGMYLYAWRRGWLDELCAEMPQREKSTKKTKWNDEKVSWAISQCSSRTELRLKYLRAYQILRDNGKLDEIFPKQNPNDIRWHSRKGRTFKK